MGKKRKGKLVDSRGYGQTQQSTTTEQSSGAPGRPSTNGTASCVPVTSSTQRILEESLSGLQVSRESQNGTAAGASPPSRYSGPSDRFRRRLTTIYDKLVGDPPHYFTHPQLERAAVALGYGITLESALDWLCLHLTAAELPPILTEGKVREDSLSPQLHQQAGAALQVIVPAPASDSTAVRRDPADPPPVEAWPAPSLAREESATPQPTCKSTKPPPCASDQSAPNKDWILQQYQYEEQDDDSDVEDPDHQNGRASNRSEARSEAKAQATEGYPSTVAADEGSEACEDPATTRCSVPTEAAVGPTEVASPDEQALLLRRRELEQIQADVNDSASNYLRSRDEVRQLQRRLRELRHLVSGLERKVEKQWRRRLPPVPSEAPPGHPVGAAPEELNEADGGLFDLFDEDAALGTSSERPSKQKAPDSTAQAPRSMQFPDDVIPKNWTGQTPQQLLHAFCAKGRLPKPSYSFDRTGCRVEIRSSDRLCAELPGPPLLSDKVAAQNYVATQLLFRVQSERPLHRILPPFYADLWREWSAVQRNAVLETKEAQKADKNQRISNLMQAIEQSRDVSGSCILKCSGVEDYGSNDGTSRDWGSAHLRNCQYGSEPDDLRVYQMFRQRCETKSYQSMLRLRSTLPIFPFRDQILDTIDKNAVTVLCAETGAGKTTNCGQFILEEALNNGQRVSILCSQPRRVAATTVAERVAEEMGEAAVGKLVGYQIRLESRKSLDTRLLFCTTGVILRRLVDDPMLHGVTHLLVDEVHERQWQVDVLLILIRNLLNGPRPDLKVVLMSATLDAELFCSFFGRAPLVTVPGRTFPVASYYLEDVLEETNHLIEEGSPCARHVDARNHSETSILVTTRGGDKRRETHAVEHDEGLSDDFIGYSLQTRRSMDRVDETIINYDLIEDLLVVLLLKSGERRTILGPPQESNTSGGSILVFLPGIGEIRALSERLDSSREFGRSGSFDIIPMHSSLSSADQRRAFRPSPAGVRKIILATNIAETSVTLPDVVCVIDTGRVRELQQDRRTSTPKLVVTWCSRASTKQRAGRAGRVQPGMCLKLFSSKTERSVMKELTEPELTRIPLEEVCLSIMATGLVKGGCRRFLNQAPQPPLEKSVDTALDRLQEIGAVTFSNSRSDIQPVCEKLTPLGNHLSQLPVDARLGKMLIYGALFKCIDPIATIVACLSASKSVFVTSWSDRTKAKAVHRMFHHPFSDFLTLVNVCQAFDEAEASGTTKRFCQDHFLSLSALREVRDSKIFFLQILCGLGFLSWETAGVTRNGARRLDRAQLARSPFNVNGRTESIVHSVVLAGLYPHVCHLLSDPTRSTNPKPTVLQHQSERLEVHSSSVNHSLLATPPSVWLAFDEKFGTGQRVTVSNTCFVDPLSLLLFGTSLEVRHWDRTVVVDQWIELRVAAQTGVMFQQFRRQLDAVLKDFCATSGSTSSSSSLATSQATTAAVVDAVVGLLTPSNKNRYH